MCDNDADTPFCAPQDGAQLQVGDTVDIKWNPSFFSALDTAPPQILIQADFPSSSPSSSPSSDTPPDGGTTGFTSPLVDTTTGLFTWTILPSDLPPSLTASPSNSLSNSTSLPALLFLAEPPTTDATHFASRLNQSVRYRGPRVFILLNPNPNDQLTSQQLQPGQPSSQPNTLAIALPIAFGVLTLLLMAGCIWLKRKRPEVIERLMPRRWGMMSRFGLGGGGGWSNIMRFRERGYGEGQSRAQRFGSAPAPVAGMGMGMGMGSSFTRGFGRSGTKSGKTGGGGVRLQGKEIKVVTTDLDGLRMNAVRMGMAERGVMGFGGVGNTSVTRGNVFREEVRRQERDRGRV